jgi:transcriptional regulator with XRE-family HTH domain
MISNRLKSLRKSKKITQNSVSKMTKIKIGTIGKIEAGINNPTVEQLIILSKFYEVSIDYLAIGTETTTNEDEKKILREIRVDKSLLDKILQVIEAKSMLVV